MRDFMTANPIIALDFDGVIKAGNDFKNMSSPPNEKAAEVIRELHEMGCILVLWTSRHGYSLEAAIDYIKKMGVWDCFVGANTEGDLSFQQGRKIFANYYVDDLNPEGFAGFPTLLRQVKADLEEYSQQNSKG